jgi:ribosomal-protein-alanine N-acetyltransferase
MSAVVRTDADGLRPMTLDDLDEVMAIETRAYRHPWTHGIFRDCLHVGYCCWVYQEHGELVAYGVMAVGAGEAHLLNLCVRPESRRQGLGRMFLVHMIDLAIAHQAATLLLEVRPSNRAALRLYRAMGFSEVGIRKGYYPTHTAHREDAIVMGRDLTTIGKQ